MRPPNSGITPEGWPCIGLLAFATLVCAILSWAPLAVLFLAGTWFALHFFRDPERVIPRQPGIAVSPADGRVVRIEIRDCPLGGDRRQCISIFMNIFSVHVNRSPLAGQVEEIRYWPGKLLNAALDKASDENERCALRLRLPDGNDFCMVQIAGLVARRIVCRAEPGDNLARGERFGMIRFGSRVDFYLPQGYKPSVEIGDQVFAGQSVIASMGKQA